MMVEIDWLEATARYLSEYYDEPFTESLEDLTRMMSEMRAVDGPSWTCFRDHMLMKHMEEDWSTEWYLMHRITTLNEFHDGSEAQAYTHADHIIGLPGLLDGPDPI